MPIRYALIENKLTTDPDDYRGRVQHNTTVTIEEVVQKIARPGSTVTAAEALAFWEELSQAVVAEVQAGNRFLSDLFVVSLTMTGTFDGAQDQFDPTRHQLRVRLAPGTRLRRAEQGLTVEQVRADSTLPLLEDLEDFTSDTRNEKLTKGGTARLTGERLKFDAKDAQQGVFLVASNGTATKVARVLTNMPGEQLFLVPATLAVGTYRVEVRNRAKNSTDMKTGSLGDTLTVA
ncbi:DUF4469 domain-containing protein [Hymenobacter sp. BT18]|uniref:DNA-binding domain-containing protein n=1 Tax=Hymenobacter sp. BT18 TaxID=2835648 RepID=UPI00143EA12B|nr:DNA-binding domain-containing protein [Hymenobacter sp. BT18]QIX61650.1 DUF4469 domain-containing protein [Hymenobacter sp. BT18]